MVKQSIYVGLTTQLQGFYPYYTHIPCPLGGPVRQELGNSFSDGMFVPDRRCNVAYIHVSLNNSRKGGEGTMTVFM